MHSWCVQAVVVYMSHIYIMAVCMCDIYVMTHTHVMALYKCDMLPQCICFVHVMTSHVCDMCHDRVVVTYSCHDCACDICVDSVHVAFMHVYVWNMAWLYVSNICIMTVYIWHIHVMTGFLHASCHDTKHDIFVWWHACHSNNEAQAWRWSSLEKSWTCFPTAYSDQVYSASLVQWERCSPREQEIWGWVPTALGRVLPVTGILVL